MWLELHMAFIRQASPLQHAGIRTRDHRALYLNSEAAEALPSFASAASSPFRLIYVLEDDMQRRIGGL